MRDPALVLVVDDNPDNREILDARLTSAGYQTAMAADGEAALVSTRDLLPDLVLLDVMMPGIDGFEVARRLKGDASLPFIPIILVTAKTALSDVVTGLDAGADDYLTKPVEHQALLARVRSMLRIKTLHDLTEAQRRELEGWNTLLEQRVRKQVAELERIGRLRRFLPPAVADLVVAESGGELASRRAEITVLFSDLRGFTAFAEARPPDEVMAALAAYHGLACPLIQAHGGTLERFLGDGLVVLFNAPVSCPDPAARAVRLAIALRDGFVQSLAPWCAAAAGAGRAGLGIGIGIAHGTTTVGPIGFQERLDYAAIGAVPNLAARLSAAAKDGQILVDGETAARADLGTPLVALGDLPIRGFATPQAVFAVAAMHAKNPQSEEPAEDGRGGGGWQ